MVAVLLVFLHQSTPTLSHVLTVLLATGPSTQRSPFCQSLYSFSLPSHSESVLPLQTSVDIYSLSTNATYTF